MGEGMSSPKSVANAYARTEGGTAGFDFRPISSLVPGCYEQYGQAPGAGRSSIRMSCARKAGDERLPRRGWRLFRRYPDELPPTPRITVLSTARLSFGFIPN